MTSLEYLTEEFWLSAGAYFDIIYIDGDNNAMAAWTDIVLAWPLLKAEGYMIFDDYYLSADKNKRTPFDVPKPAIDKFLEDYATECELIRKGQIVIVKKLGV